MGNVRKDLNADLPSPECLLRASFQDIPSGMSERIPAHWYKESFEPVEEHPCV